MNLCIPALHSTPGKAYQQGMYRNNYKASGENAVMLEQSKNGYYGITDNGVDFRKIKLRFEVKVLYALK